MRFWSIGTCKNAETTMPDKNSCIRHSPVLDSTISSSATQDDHITLSDTSESSGPSLKQPNRQDPTRLSIHENLSNLVTQEAGSCKNGTGYIESTSAAEGNQRDGERALADILLSLLVQLIGDGKIVSNRSSKSAIRPCQGPP